MPMKPEIGYPDVVMGSFIEDLIGDLEHNMGLVSANDQYFKELSHRRSGRVCGEDGYVGKRNG